MQPARDFPRYLILAFTLSLLAMQLPGIGHLREVASQAGPRSSPLARVARALDAELAPGGRVFVSGVLGPEHAPRLGIYYHLVYYLFPRRLSITSPGAPRFEETHATGAEPEGAAGLAERGYDYRIAVSSGGLAVVDLRSRPR